MNFAKNTVLVSWDKTLLMLCVLTNCSCLLSSTFLSHSSNVSASRCTAPERTCWAGAAGLRARCRDWLQSWGGASRSCGLWSLASPLTTPFWARPTMFPRITSMFFLNRWLGFFPNVHLKLFSHGLFSCARKKHSAKSVVLIRFVFNKPIFLPTSLVTCQCHSWLMS